MTTLFGFALRERVVTLMVTHLKKFLISLASCASNTRPSSLARKAVSVSRSASAPTPMANRVAFDARSDVRSVASGVRQSSVGTPSETSTNVGRYARLGDLVKRMKDGQFPVVAGFQGLGPDNRITTLGRGGSDTSAVALAAALNADRCDIFTDVDGVYTTDPRIVTKARKLDKITYEEMLEMASLGAKVLQTRSVELAMNHGVRVQVLSSFVDAPGTMVVDEGEIVEQQVVSGIAYSKDEAKITLVKVADRPGIAAGIFGPLADAAINVDMIVQNVSEDGKSTDLTFTVTKADLDRTVQVLESRKADLDYKAITPDPNVVKVSVIGVGMRSHAGVAQTMFKTLADRGINIQVISTSEIKISVLINEEYTELALRALHTAYGLDAA